MERRFHEELNDLKAQVLRMGGLAQDMIKKASQALFERNENLSREVFELEKTANRFHVEVDEKCVNLLALQQPMAADLRMIAACMKINTDLERVADQAVNISQTFYYHLFKEPPVPQVAMILRMAALSQNMLRDSLEAFARNNTDMAFGVLKQEEEEDRLKSKAMTDLIGLIRLDPSRSEQFVDLILLSRNMERVGDHATNIAEDVIFMALGKDIRHQPHPEPRLVEGPAEG